MSKAYTARVELDRIKETAAIEQRGKEGEAEEAEERRKKRNVRARVHEYTPRRRYFLLNAKANAVGKYTESYFLDRYDTVRTQIAFFSVFLLFILLLLRLLLLY